MNVKNHAYKLELFVKRQSLTFTLHALVGVRRFLKKVGGVMQISRRSFLASVALTPVPGIPNETVSVVELADELAKASQAEKGGVWCAHVDSDFVLVSRSQQALSERG
jgi:hypothetical protein